MPCFTTPGVTAETYDPGVPEPTGDTWITVPVAARLLGLELHTVYDAIDRGELQAEVTMPDPPKRRRSVRLRRQDVDDFVERARVKPGELRHLYP
jgi:excisionase family DNA binding protein